LLREFSTIDRISKVYPYSILPNIEVAVHGGLVHFVNLRPGLNAGKFVYFLLVDELVGCACCRDVACVENNKPNLAINGLDAILIRRRIPATASG
jgi:hypothetical protein